MSARLSIIDDHELVREGLRVLIESQETDRYRIVYAGGSVEQAIASGPEIALLDVELAPGEKDVAGNCADLVQAGVGVLLISAHDDAVAIRAGLNAGALGFVPKRVTYAELQEGLGAVGEGQMYLSMDLAAILAADPDVPDLSPRERDALRLYASGLKLAAVARRMDISPHTVKEYLDRVRAKYQQVGRPARTRTELYVEASRDGLLEGDS